MQNKNVLILFFLLLTSLFVSGTLYADEEYKSIDLDQIIERGYLDVGILNFDCPPFIIDATEENPKGLDIEIAKDIGRKMGVEVRIIPCAKSWNQLIEKVAKGEVDFAISQISSTLEREIKVDLSKPYLTFRYSLLLNQVMVEETGLVNSDRTVNIPDRNDFSIGTVKDSAYSGFYFETRFPYTRIVLFKDLDEGLTALQNRKITAFFYNDMDIWNFLRENPKYALLFYLARSEREDPIAIAIGQGRTELLRWLNKYIDTYIPEITPQRLYSWYEEGMKTDILEHYYEFKVDAVNQNIWMDLIGVGKNIWGVTSGIVILCLFIGLCFWKFPAGISVTHFILRALFRILRWKGMYLICLAGGVLFGIIVKGAAYAWIKPIAGIFISAMQMCALPIMVTAVTTGIAAIARNKNFSSYIARLVSIIAIILFFCSLTTYLAVNIKSLSGAESKTQSTELGNIILEADQGNSILIDQDLQQIKLSIIPKNILMAMTQDNMLGVLTFSILLGLALGILRNKKSDSVLRFLDGVFSAIQKIVEWILILLPIALFSLGYIMVLQNPKVLLSMSKFIGIFYVLCTAWFIGGFLLTCKYIRERPSKTFSLLKQSLITSFATGNEYSVLPIVLDALKESKIDVKVLRSVFPLSIAVCDLKKLIMFVIAPLYFANIIGNSIAAGGTWYIIPIGAIILVLATSGMKSAIYIPFLSLLLIPLGLPAGSIITLLFLAYPFMDPVGATLNVQTSIAVTGFVNKKIQTHT